MGLIDYNGRSLHCDGSMALAKAANLCCKMDSIDMLKVETTHIIQKGCLGKFYDFLG